MQYIFRAENVSKQYAQHLALNNVSVEVPKNSVFGLLGPNGAGKTTLIRIINQIIAPDQGQLWFMDEKLAAHHVKRIGYLPEERGLYKKMKVGEQALYLARLKDVPHKQAKLLLKEWFEKFDLMHWWDKKVEELSKGMQQKVQFIVTILHKPDLLIFDEPFSGFDPINVNLLKEEILRLKQQGTTIIFSTHNMNSVEELCDHIALINKSENILHGDLETIRAQHATHIFELEVDNKGKSLEEILPSFAKLIDHKEKTSSKVQLTINIDDQYSSNDLISAVIPQVELISFREKIPGMNDIFIKTVTGKFPHELNKDDLSRHLGLADDVVDSI